MSVDYQEDSELLKALAHPVRLKIVEGLLNRECNVNKIVKALNIPQSTVSQHLAILRNRGVVQVRKEGVKTCYRVSNSKVSRLLKILSE
ncbi:MAG: metalloregulator ArsR/SmtB family transcription factor [Candidatus Omnitrophica bacterium]|nr:metalloregulator ArsR/SmtB family transcription factor [Candidatus Omnitrophota bacterium]